MAKIQPINVTFHFRERTFCSWIFLCMPFFHSLDILLLLIISFPAFLFFRIFFLTYETTTKMVHICWISLEKRNPWTLARVPFDVSGLFFCFVLNSFGLPIILDTFSHLPRWKDLMFSIRDVSNAVVPKQMALSMHLHFFLACRMQSMMRRYLKRHFWEIAFTLVG